MRPSDPRQRHCTGARTGDSGLADACKEFAPTVPFANYLLYCYQALVVSSPYEARTLLQSNPQLSYALFQAMLMMNIVDPAILHVSNNLQSLNLHGPRADHHFSLTQRMIPPPIAAPAPAAAAATPTYPSYSTPPSAAAGYGAPPPAANPYGARPPVPAAPVGYGAPPPQAAYGGYGAPPAPAPAPAAPAGGNADQAAVSEARGITAHDVLYRGWC